MLPLFAIAPVTTPVPVLFLCQIPHTPYDMLVLTLVLIMLVLTLVPIIMIFPDPSMLALVRYLRLSLRLSLFFSHCFISHTPYDMLVLTLVSIILAKILS
jgi:hypothetical protein